MGAIVRMFDGLRNLASGLGVAGQDKQASASWVFIPVTRMEIDAAHRSTWLGRKIHDIPPKDMTREWRAWQAEDNQIEAIEGEETRLKLQQKVRRALTMAVDRWGSVEALSDTLARMNRATRVVSRMV